MARLDPAAQLPLSAAVLHILLVLADGERHGYGIAQEVEATTGGRLRMGPGTLYGSIQRMLRASLIEESLAPKEARDSADAAAAERRRYYRISAFGRRVLALELERLDGVLRVAREKRLLRPA